MTPYSVRSSQVFITLHAQFRLQHFAVTIADVVTITKISDTIIISLDVDLSQNKTFKSGARCAVFYMTAELLVHTCSFPLFNAVKTRGHSVEHIPPPRHIEIGTVSLPARSRHKGLNFLALRRN